METKKQISVPASEMSLVNTILTITFCVVACVYVRFRWKRRRLYYLASKVHGPKEYPLLGSALMLAGDQEHYIHVLTKVFNDYGTCKFWMGPGLYYFIAQPEQIHIVFNSPETHNKGGAADFIVDLFGTGLITNFTPTWKPHRKVVLQMFNQSVLNSFIPIFEDHTKALIIEWSDKAKTKQVFDVLPVLSRLTLDMICETALGVKVGDEHNTLEVHNKLKRILKIIAYRMHHIIYYSNIVFGLTMKKEVVQCLQYIKNFTKKIVDERREICKGIITEKVNIKERPLVDVMLALTENNSVFTEEEFLDEILTLILAGSDSTASTNGAALLMLGLHKDIQEKIYKEINEIFCGIDRPATNEDLNKMKYLENVIKEALRLFPIAPIVLRKVQERELSIGDITLPVGACIAIPIFCMHRTAKYWKDPLIFNPDRWDTDEIIPNTFLPFTLGPRTCVGAKYAMMAMKTVLFNIVKYYKICATPIKVADIRLEMDVILKPKEGYCISLEHRH